MAERLLEYKRKKEDRKKKAAKESKSVCNTSRIKKNLRTKHTAVPLQCRDGNIQPKIHASKPSTFSVKTNSSHRKTASKFSSKGPSNGKIINVTKRTSRERIKKLQSKKPMSLHTLKIQKINSAQKTNLKRTKQSTLTSANKKISAAKKRPGTTKASSSRKYSNKKKQGEKPKKIFKFVKIRVRAHNKLKWRDINVKRAAPFSQLVKQLAKSLGECVALEKISGELSMKPEFYITNDCSNLDQEGQYIVHSKTSKTLREAEYIRYSAATKIQAWYRLKCAFNAYIKTRHSTIQIQSLARLKIARNLIVRKKKSIFKIQATFFSSRLRKLYQKYLRALCSLQIRFKFQRKKAASVKISSVFRRYLQQKEIRKWNCAATIVQSLVRSQKPRRNFLNQVVASTQIQKQWRIFKWRLYEENCTHLALTLQKVSRGWILRRRMHQLSTFFVQVIYKV